jgi:hypothetical protein
MIHGLATPWAVPGGPGEGTATAEVAAVETANAPVVGPAIVLQGPPSGSSFGLEARVSFYWQLPEGSAAGRRFIVYLDNSEGRVALGAVDGANLGSGYRLQAILSEAASEPGTYNWFVALENPENGEIIGQSESRPLSIVGEN